MEQNKERFYVVWKRIFIFYLLFAFIVAVVLLSLFTDNDEHNLEILDSYELVLFIGFFATAVFILQVIYRKQQRKSIQQQKIPTDERTQGVRSKMSPFYFVYKVFLCIIFIPTLILFAWGGTGVGELFAPIFLIAPFVLLIPAFLAADRKQKGSKSRKDTCLLFLPLLIPPTPAIIASIENVFKNVF